MQRRLYFLPLFFTAFPILGEQLRCRVTTAAATSLGMELDTREIQSGATVFSSSCNVDCIGRDKKTLGSLTVEAPPNIPGGSTRAFDASVTLPEGTSSVRVVSCSGQVGINILRGIEVPPRTVGGIGEGTVALPTPKPTLRPTPPHSNKKAGRKA